MSISEKKSKHRSSAARGHEISDLANAVGWILCPPDLPISEGWVVVTADDTSSGTMRRINGAETAQKTTLRAVFGRSDRALLRLRITPGTYFNIGETQHCVEKLRGMYAWARLFAEYGGASLPDVSLVPNGTTQSVYWVDGSTIVRVSRDGVWDYSVSDEGEPSSVHGGVLSSDVLSRDGAPHGL